MGKYIIKRLLQLIPVLIGITFLSFAMMRLAGGDAVTYMYENAGSAVSQEVIDNAKAEYGLDKPFLVQYAAWFAGMVTGDMGESYVSHRDVYETFISKLPATMMLTLSSILLTIVLAIPLGILSAVKHNKWVDYLIRFLSFIGNSMPNFFAAMVLMYFLSIRLGVLPVVTNTDLGLCDRSPGKRDPQSCDHLEECNEGFHADDHHTAGSVRRQSSGRNCHCGKYLYVGWCRKTGGRCDHHA